SAFEHNCLIMEGKKKPKPKRPTCHCKAYNWPHRPGSGLCNWPDEPKKICNTPAGTQRKFRNQWFSKPAILDKKEDK
ncbi:unnamed protein product, partial [marine sediment metagenome]